MYGLLGASFALEFFYFEILKLYRDLLAACQCQGTGTNVAGNA